jgi:hypothetical protein
MSQIRIRIPDFMTFVENTICPSVALEPLVFRRIGVIGGEHNVEGTITSRGVFDAVALTAWTMETDNTH